MANKTDLINDIAEKLGVPKKTVTAVVDELFGQIVAKVANNDKVTCIGFGIFERRYRAARKGQNPRTGEKIEIAESHTVSFKPGKQFKEAVK